MWFSAAICIKIIPAFLLLVPAWRRDLRMLSGSIVGLILGMIIIPVIAMGPQKTFNGYQSFYKETVLAGIKGDTEGSRGEELTGITSTDSNLPMVVMHNIMYPDVQNRPEVAAPCVRIAHWLIAVFMTLSTLLAAGWKGSGRLLSGRIDATSREVLFFGTLLPVIFIISPVFHPHYVSMVIPLITVIVSILWDRYSYPNIPFGWKVLFWSLIISHLLTSIDLGIFLYLRDFGLVLLTTFLLWLGSIFLLCNTAKPNLKNA